MAYLKHEGRSLLYCPVPKCGWTSWRTMLFKELSKEKSTVNAILQDDSRFRTHCFERKAIIVCVPSVHFTSTLCTQFELNSNNIFTVQHGTARVFM